VASREGIVMVMVDEGLHVGEFPERDTIRPTPPRSPPPTA